MREVTQSCHSDFHNNYDFRRRFLTMELKEFSINYTTPHTEIIEMEVENAILSASDANVENPVEGEESDW